MILTCPQCATQFNIDPDILGDEGKTVRCSSCKETWFQTPDDDEMNDWDSDDHILDESIDIDMVQTRKDPEDIPEGVKPLPEDKEEATPPPAPPSESEKKAKRTSLIAIAAIWIIIGALLIILQAPLVNLLSGGHGPDAHGLSFDRISVTQENGQTIINGYILNLTDDQKSIPLMTATVSDQDHHTLATWRIAPPEQTIAGQESLTFSAAYNKIFPDTAKIEITF